ncbi:hypothetical protein B0T10DRAFT_481020 [Thelonectria olida]|uniref:Uncharacterized protein n=1 Tax=Thelonectria olida TaxID=1576542 RepID=A0A9P8WBI6_9HYPO|nr:hypothetical protein B0T10DRAFT_481020 [Thelonectria olida]
MSGKRVSEAARERETFRYDSALITNSVRNDVTNLIPSSDLRACSDPSLTALAQAALLRLKASRALVSLFDRQFQYIVAEATPTLRISANAESPEADSDKLWLCGTSVPRSFGVCELALVPPEESGLECREPWNDKLPLPVTVIGDLSEHVILRRKDLCRTWPQSRFYAGVPIRSRQGINIGVFCIFDGEPRSGLDEVSIHLMQDVSKAIVDHLELRQFGDGQRSGARMVRGLGSYVEGKATMSGWRDTRPPHKDDAAKEGYFHQKQQDLQREQDDRASHLLTEAGRQDGMFMRRDSLGEFSISPGFTPNGAFSASVNPNVPPPRAATPADVSPDAQLHLIFSKAANVLRESIEVEGVLFLDASVEYLAGSVGSGSLRRPTEQRSSSSSSPYDWAHSSASESTRHSKETRAHCTVLGFSTSLSSSIDDEASTPARFSTVPERFLRKLLGRYPKGKIFNYDEHGLLASSDFSSEDTPSTIVDHQLNRGTTSKLKEPEKPQWRRKGRFSRQNESKEIASLFPGARSVCVLPLWDSHRRRWFAGGFLYTTTPTRIFTIQGELSYLTAFGNVIMADVALMNSAIVNSATTSLLNSLSHELRSPLHGIVLCAELLHDTSLNVFQGDVLRSIEICGRTMLDTINHLLDWTKINNFMQSSDKQSSRAATVGLPPRKSSITDGMMHITSDLDVDILVEEVVECVHAGHTYQQYVVRRRNNYEPSQGGDVDPHTRLDSIDALENIGATGTSPNAYSVSSTVVLILDIDPAVDWAFHGQPGALRRIILNLCGNSLKYTTRGFVKVAAYQEPAKNESSRERIIHIDVIDTGPGIGEDYLHRLLFTPFTQEHAHTPGAGLGLSLVKKFVRALGGSIRVHSQLGKGTRVALKLPLQVSSPELTNTAAIHEEFRAQVVELSSLRVSVAGFSSTNSGLHPSDWNLSQFDEKAVLGKICRDWLHMLVVEPHARADFLPDLILCDEGHFATLAHQALTEAASPVIVVCHSPAAARQVERTYKAAKRMNRGLFSFISRPLGPRKLAKALVLSFRRWTKLQANAKDHSSLSTMLDPTVPVSERRPTVSVSDAAEGGYFDIPKGSPPIDGHDTETPSCDSAVKTPMPLSSQSTHPPHQPTEHPQTPQPRFLLVEDNQINMRILQTYMKKLGHNYDSATDGLQALNSYKSRGGDYQCVLMDLSMPVLDGFESTRRMRAFEEENKLPRCHILAISGLASKDAQEDAFLVGLDLFLSKPVQLKELSRVLESRGIF